MTSKAIEGHIRWPLYLKFNFTLKGLHPQRIATTKDCTLKGLHLQRFAPTKDLTHGITRTLDYLHSNAPIWDSTDIGLNPYRIGPTELLQSLHICSSNSIDLHCTTMFLYLWFGHKTKLLNLWNDDFTKLHKFYI